MRVELLGAYLGHEARDVGYGTQRLQGEPGRLEGIGQQRILDDRFELLGRARFETRHV